jgi:DNA-binding MarR family transcriptional regulator
MAAVVSEGLARQYSERFGIGISEWRILATVGEFRSVTATSIGLHAYMSKVKVSRAATSLERRGLIRRVPNRDDLREAFLVLTVDGERLYGEITPLALAYAQQLTADLTTAETALLDRLIETLLRRGRELRDESI